MTGIVVKIEQLVPEINATKQEKHSILGNISLVDSIYVKSFSTKTRIGSTINFSSKMIYLNKVCFRRDSKKFGSKKVNIRDSVCVLHSLLQKSLDSAKDSQSIYHSINFNQFGNLCINQASNRS